MKEKLPEGYRPVPLPHGPDIDYKHWYVVWNLERNRRRSWERCKIERRGGHKVAVRHQIYESEDPMGLGKTSVWTSEWVEFHDFKAADAYVRAIYRMGI